MLFQLPLKIDNDFKNLKDELLNTDWFETTSEISSSKQNTKK